MQQHTPQPFPFTTCNTILDLEATPVTTTLTLRTPKAPILLHVKSDIILLPTYKKTKLKTSPASCAMNIGATSLKVKQSGRKADHSPASTAEVKNELSYASTPQYVFMA